MEIEPITGSVQEIETTVLPASYQGPAAAVADDEDVEDLETLFDQITQEDQGKTLNESIALLCQIVLEPRNRFGPRASSIKERAIYVLARTYCAAGQHDEVVSLLTGSTCAPFFHHVTKAKFAKVVRAVLDIVCDLLPHELDTQQRICENIIEWTQREKRSFLRQRVQAKLASILLQQKKYRDALSLVQDLLAELKKLDDKQLLVETHLVESKIQHALNNLPKAKAALTATRTCANAIYVPPLLQSSIDSMSGVLHCEEGDYNTAHSYFLEAFEQLDQLESDGKLSVALSPSTEEEEGVKGAKDDDDEIPPAPRTAPALTCLKYMMLCKILHGLTKALQSSAKGERQAKASTTHGSMLDVTSLVSAKHAVKYAGKDMEAMAAIASAASQRSLSLYENVVKTHAPQLQHDILIKHHLDFLHEQLLESNLIRIIEPFSCVEIDHVAELMEMPLPIVEKKLSQMILDGTLHGILDQGKGQLIVYEEHGNDRVMEKGLQVIANMDDVVTSLFQRSHELRATMV
jgi:26S proteasome regulatory complex component